MVPGSESGPLDSCTAPGCPQTIARYRQISFTIVLIGIQPQKKLDLAFAQACSRAGTSSLEAQPSMRGNPVLSTHKSLFQMVHRWLAL